MIAQAEHAPGSSVLVTWSDRVLDAAAAALADRLGRLARGDLARQSLEEYGALVRVRDADEACQLADLFAPEHLHIATTDAESLMAKISHAGAVFLGPHSPVAVGDYAAGPSHVLPTGGTARFAHGLSANDFLRPHSVIHITKSDLTDLAADVRLLADKEGLTAHRESVEVRLPSDRSPPTDH
jgi:histidinol dehydrogenase